MIYFCLLVSTVVGAWCFDAPATFTPPGYCNDIGDILICDVDAHELKLRPSYYDPFIEHDDPFVRDIQCMEPCNLLGDGTPVVDGYGRFAACVPGWYGKHVEMIWYDGATAVRQCRDHGGAVHPRCGDVFAIDRNGIGKTEFSCYIPIDLLERHAHVMTLLMVDWRFLDE